MAKETAKIVGVRFDESQLHNLKTLCEHYDRNMSNMIIWLVNEAMKKITEEEN